MSNKPPTDDDELDQEEFDNLIKQIGEDPECLLTDDISPDKISALYKKINENTNPFDPRDKGKEILFSYTNLRETYMKRMLMTGMVGYVYQMLKECTVDENDRSWFPTQPAEKEPFTAQELVDRTRNMALIAEHALAAQMQYENASARSARAMELREKAPETLTEAEQAELAALPPKESLENDEQAHLFTSEFCKYRCTYDLTLTGRAAQDRIVKTRKQAIKIKEVKQKCDEEGMKYIEPPGKITMPEEKAKNVVRSFLDTFFKFDPSVHVRSGASNSNKVDTSKIVLSDETGITLEYINNTRKKPPASEKQLLTDINYLTSDKEIYNAGLYLSRDGKLRDIVTRMIHRPKDYEEYLIPRTNHVMMIGSKVQKEDLPSTVVPPQDTFHRWSYYMEVNQSCIRTITEAIYPERCDLDVAFGIWAVLDGSEDEKKRQYEAHCDRYSNRITSSVYRVPLGDWVVVSDHEKNRQNIDIYNRDTMVLKKILDRHAEDKKIGAELMRNRVSTAKAKNVREAGQDAPNLSTYKSANKSMTSSKTLSSEEMLRLRADNGDKVARDELKQIDQLREFIQNIDMKTMAGQEIPGDESERYASAKRELEIMLENLEVPDNAVRVDVFETKGDTMTKKTIYTAAD